MTHFSAFGIGTPLSIYAKVNEKEDLIVISVTASVGIGYHLDLPTPRTFLSLKSLLQSQLRRKGHDWQHHLRNVMNEDLLSTIVDDDSRYS